MVSSPLEQFEVTSLFHISAPVLGGWVLSLTNLGLYAIIVVFLAVGTHFVSSNRRRLVPSGWSLGLESLYASVLGIVREQIGPRNEVYLPLIYTLFVFVLVANLNGNVPYGFTITTSAIVSLGLSVTIFLAVTTLGLVKHGVHFFSFFVPSGTPLALVPLLVLIELISYSARALSLGVRLFANVVAGHTLLKILSTFLLQLFSSSVIVALVTLVPFTIFIALIGLEVAVSFIQAYVFTVLTCTYIRDAEYLH